MSVHLDDTDEPRMLLTWQKKKLLENVSTEAFQLLLPFLCSVHFALI